MRIRLRRSSHALAGLVVLSVALLALVVPIAPAAAATISQSAACISVTNTWANFAIQISATAPATQLAQGADYAVTGTSLGVTVPSAIIAAGYNTGLVTEGTNSVVSTVKLRLKATNTSNLTQVVQGSLPIDFTVDVHDSTGVVTVVPDPVVGTVVLGDSNWTTTGGDSVLASDDGPPPSGPLPSLAEKNNAPIQILNKVNGTVNANFYCWPGTAASDGASMTPGSSVAVATVPVTGTGTSSTTTTSTTTTSTSTTSTSTTTTTTALSSTPTTTPVSVSGSRAYAATCSNSVTPDRSEISFTVAGTAPGSATTGSAFALTAQKWTVGVPSSVLTTGVNLGLLKAGDVVQGTLRGGVAGSGTQEGTQTAEAPISVGPIELDADGAAKPASVTVDTPDSTWTPTGGDVGFTLAKSVVEVSIGALKVAFTCDPPADAAAFVTTKVTGAATAVLGATATRAAAGGAAGGGATLARTGTMALILQAVAGLALLDLGYLAWSAARRPRRRQVG